MRRAGLILQFGLLSFFLPGCIVIPIGDLLKPPLLQEQVLIEGDGFFSKEKIAIVEVDGMISGDESANPFVRGENVVGEIKARLDRMRSDPQVRAVVLRISSPGGEVTACDVLHSEIERFKKETKIPVIASISNQGTSGAYYLAVAADTIYAHPTAVVGSIGVLFQHVDLTGLLEKIGVSASPIKSAEKKDIGSILRPMTAEERQILQKLVDDMYQRFVTVVDEGRPQLKREEVLALADGRVVSGGEAAALKLVDRIGYLADALEDAKKRAGIRSPTIVHYTRIARSGANIYTHAGNLPPAAGDVELSLKAGLTQGSNLYYLWKPGW